MNSYSLFLNIITVILPIVGYQIVDIFISNCKFSYYSMFNNFSFVVKTLFEFLIRFPATHYGYTMATKELKEILETQPTKLREFFYLINLQWVRISFYLLIGTISKFLLTYLGIIWRNYQNKKHGKGFINKLDHSDCFSNIIMIIAYLGFYQSLLSPVSLILISLNLLMIFIIDKFLKKSSKQNNLYTLYISFNNIIMLVQLSLFTFAIGGFFAFDFQYVYSSFYFTNQNQILYAPFFLITSLTILIIPFPALFLLMRHNSVSLRILDRMIERNTYNHQQENIPRVKEVYSEMNPYNIEREKLTEINNY